MSKYCTVTTILSAVIFILNPSLQSGEGRTRVFYVKDVNPGTLAWRAGIQAGDKIIKVTVLIYRTVVKLNSAILWRW